MSVKALFWAMEQREVTTHEKLVLIVLANFSNDIDKCWPSYQRISEDARISRKSAIEVVKRLHDRGFITIEGRKNNAGADTSNIFKLNISASTSKAEKKGSHPELPQGHSASPQGHPGSLGESLEVTQGVTGGDWGSHSELPKPVIKPINKPVIKPIKEPSPPIPPQGGADCSVEFEEVHEPDGDSPQSILAYLNLRAGTRYQPTDSNLKLIRARLAEKHTSQDLRRVIDSKTDQWLKDPKMSTYLRPATLFNAEKFSQYMGQVGVKAMKTNAQLMEDLINGVDQDDDDILGIVDYAGSRQEKILSIA